MNVFYKWSCYNNTSQFYSGTSVSKIVKPAIIDPCETVAKAEDYKAVIVDLPHKSSV